MSSDRILITQAPCSAMMPSASRPTSAGVAAMSVAHDRNAVGRKKALGLHLRQDRATGVECAAMMASTLALSNASSGSDGGVRISSSCARA